MTKTAEELYEERVSAATHGLVVEFLERAVDFLEVSEFLEEVGEYDATDDFVKDVQNSVNGELGDILQRWEDSDH